MIVRKAYRYRLKTNPEIDQSLFRQAGCVRWIWNQVWRMNKLRLEARQPLLWYQESAFWLKLWKSSEEFAFLRDCHSQPLQQALKDLDRAYRDGFDKTQPLKRLPRLKKKHQGASFRYPQGVKLKNRQVYLPKIGWVGFFKSRELVGTLKNTTVSHQAGHWYVSLQVEEELPEPVHPGTGAVGIDLGVARFATLSDGIIHSPAKSLGKQQTRLAQVQRQLSRKKKFSNNWRKQVRQVQMLHHKMACSRSDFLHKASNQICKNHAMIMIEDLQVRNMSRSAKGSVLSPGKQVKAKSGLNRSILAQGWGEFRRQLEYKSQWQGGYVLAVAAHHTSQSCSVCGHVAKENRLSQATFQCVICGHTENADVNAAKNIKARGLRVLACGETMHEDRSMKQEPVGYREVVPPVMLAALRESPSL